MTPFPRRHYRSSVDGDTPSPGATAQLRLHIIPGEPAQPVPILRLEAEDGSWVETNQGHDLLSSILQFLQFSTLRPWQTRQEIEALKQSYLQKASKERTPLADVLHAFSQLSNLSLEDLL